MPVKDKMGYILRKYTRRAVWAGSLNQMQDLEILREIAAALPDELAVILITDEKELPQFLEEIPSNIFIFHQLARKDVEYIIKQCQAGFAFYRSRSEEHTSELQSRGQLVCRLLLENKKHVT